MEKVDSARLRSSLFHISCALTIVLALSCAAGPPAPPPAPAVTIPSATELRDHEGDSPETAVAVPADAPNDGVRFENEWIFGRVGRFRRLSQGTGVLTGRRYDIIEVETPLGGKYKFFFDITENWDRWKPDL